MFTLTEKVNYKYYNNIYVIKKILRNIAIEHSILALDFETMPKHTKEDKDNLNSLYEANNDVLLLPSIHSSGLSYPSLVDISHLSIGWSKNEAVVIICSTEAIRDAVFDWLVSIENLQIWSNASFDFKHIRYNTGLFPRNYEDVQLIDKARKNHCENHKALVGLKETMGFMYGDWAIDKQAFTIENMYDERMLEYAAIDACATYARWELLKYDNTIKPRCNNPIDLLPLKAHPINGEPKEKDFFYRNVVKALIEDFVELMLTGIPISIDKVQELEPKVDKVLQEADEVFKGSKLIKEYLKLKHVIEIEAKKEELLKKRKTALDYKAEFKPNNKVHRSAVINTYLINEGKDKYLLDAWNLKDIKQLLLVYPSVFLEEYLNKAFDTPLVESNILKGMDALAKQKAELYNKTLDEKINNLSSDTEFNPNSAVQKRELLWDYLGVESDTVSKKTGDYSYNRDELQRILKEIDIKLEE